MNVKPKGASFVVYVTESCLNQQFFCRPVKMYTMLFYPQKRKKVLRPFFVHRFDRQDSSARNIKKGCYSCLDR